MDWSLNTRQMELLKKKNLETKQMTCSCNIIITFTRLQPLHMCDSQLFMCTDDCALHLLFMLTVGLPSRINADGENCRGRWE